MSKEELGRLEKVELRDQWEREDTNFTPWLAKDENIELLGQTIGIELEVQQQEANVGPFKADILCKSTSDNSFVIIENQLEGTDHKHLGQLITYAAGLNAVTLVWVVEKMVEEHRAALDWLNRITDEGINFFGLEIELWRIGSSKAAPKFNLAVKPNDWAKTMKEAAEASHSVLSGGQVLQVEYWRSFGEFLSRIKAPFKPPKPYPSNWMGYGVGRTGAGMLVVANQNEASVVITTNNREHKAWYHLLLEQKDIIHEELGYELQWDEREDKKESSIRIGKKIDISKKDSWPQIHQWMMDRMADFQRVFKKRIKALNDDDWVAE